MTTFDPYLRRVTRWVEERIRSGGEVRQLEAAAAPEACLAELREQDGGAGRSAIVLGRETFVELGSPRAGSCAFSLCTNDLSLLRDGRITRIGPGIQASAGASLPFGQVLLVGGAELTDGDWPSLEQTQYVSDRIPGYMIRSTPGRLWSRVSKEAAARGFEFDALGRALIGIFKRRLPKVEAMEVVFVTSAREDLRALEEIAEQVRTIGRHVEQDIWRAKGYDLECTLGVDCKACDDKPACDEIRDVIRIRKRRPRGTAESAS